MRLSDAAEAVLQSHGMGRPMHYRAITEHAISDGLIAPGGLTPQASVNASISSEIRQRALSGEPQRFTAYGRGFYGLTQSRAAGEIEDAVRKNNLEVRERLHAELRDMDPREFEELIGRLLDELGFVDVEVTSYSGDGGIDVRGTLAVGGVTNVRTAIQVKRWSNNVSGRTVRELRGGLSPHERGLIITTSDFTRDAISEAATADRTPISLVSGEMLVDLLIQHSIGIVRIDLPILRLDLDALLPLEAQDGAGEEEAITPAPRRLRRARAAGGKNLALWPMPGGRGNFVQSLTSMLTYVSEHEPTVDQFVEWIFATFASVNSRKTAIGYIQVPRGARLIETVADRFRITADAAAYLSSMDEEDLYKAMAANIAGFDETMERLSESPSTPSEITSHLNESLGTSWTSDAQAGWRLRWLESFGKARRDGDRYTVVV